MSNIINKGIRKIVAVIVIVLLASSFREMMSDKEFYTAFGGLMGTLPFAKQITDIVCKILKYQNNIPVFSNVTILEDILKLAIMAFLQPFAGTALTGLFLKVPSNYKEREEYMEGSVYKMKELAVNVISAPILALLAAYLTTMIIEYIKNNLGNISSVIVAVASVVGVFAVSLIPLIKSGVSMLKAFLWRLTGMLVGGMIKSYGINAMSLALYIGILKGMPGMIGGSVLGLIIWLIIFDVGMKLIRESIVSL